MSGIVHVVSSGNYSEQSVPRCVFLSTTDDIDVITAAGYLHTISEQIFYSSDVIFADYDTDHKTRLFSLAVDASTKVATMSLMTDVEPTDLPVVEGNIPQFKGTRGGIEDSDIAASAILLTTTDVTDYQQIVGLNEILIASVGTWTRMRVAEGNYVLRHTAADDTSVIGIDITPAIRAAAGRGFKLASFDVIYAIATLALDAHTVVLDRVAYANNVAVAVTSVPLTVTLATATQAQPYLTNAVVATPAFDVTANSKYVAELTVNAAATSAYDFYGLNLHFTKSVA